VIHKIKGLHDDGCGLSIRAISQELGISRNTVRKYLRADEVAIATAQLDRSREKRLDEHRDYIVHLLGAFPKLSAVKVARKLREKLGELEVSDRSIRRYVQMLKRTHAVGQRRYYEPVIDHLPGVQCQIDPGELRGVLIGGEARTVYFVAFVLSFSRLMYVGVSFTPIDTAGFIQLHDEAFRYFGGVPEECVYDQTKMVVIQERFRELTVNQRFHEYATAAGFRVHACEGYDPESKGKVEAAVKYVKQDCLYGETFIDHQGLRGHVLDWLETVANARVHGTTHEVPRARFEAQEREHLRPYLTPACLDREAQAGAQRRADKTGLVSWRSNKYSVPMPYQCAAVGVREAAGELLISDLESGERIAVHALCTEKGRIIKNNNHYRDHAQRITELEAAIEAQLDEDVGRQLCRLLKRTSPRIYKDQLRAVRNLLREHAPLDPALTAQLVERPQLTATTVQRYLEAHRRAQARGRDDVADPAPARAPALSLHQYAAVGRSSGQELTHEPA